MPELTFKSKEFVYNHHLSVPFRPLVPYPDKSIGGAALNDLLGLPQTVAIPVAFMTAKVQPGEVANYMELGAVDVIAKPFDPMTLANKVQDIWTRCHG